MPSNANRGYVFGAFWRRRYGVALFFRRNDKRREVSSRRLLALALFAERCRSLDASARRCFLPTGASLLAASPEELANYLARRSRLRSFCLGVGL